MSAFFKVLLRGIIVTLLFPLIVAFLAVAAVYCLIAYIILLIRNTVVFFKGGDVSKFKEDKQAEEILNAQKNTEQNMTQVLTDIMHSAIKQNPEAVQAMAQQEIFSQKVETQKAQEASQSEIQQINVVENVSEVNEESVVEEVVNND